MTIDRGDPVGRLAKVIARPRRVRAGVTDMHTLLARSALDCGAKLVAGMLLIIGVETPRPRPIKRSERGFELVSWRAGARSRREDELARSREALGI